MQVFFSELIFDANLVIKKYQGLVQWPFANNGLVVKINM